jgi:membrane protein implicated in regulation of membrane protease activity
MFIVEFYESYPMWTWFIVAAIILATEVSTGSGWLLWPAACAAVVGVLAAFVRVLGFPGELLVFAVLAIASSLTANKYLKPKDTHPGVDINDRSGALVGKTGKVVEVSATGRVRVNVDGSEWDAETASDLAEGAKVRVTQVLSGSRVQVEAV